MKIQDPEIARYLGYPEDTWFKLKPKRQLKREEKKQRRFAFDMELLRRELISIEEFLSR
jgi:hypothetical protein